MRTGEEKIYLLYILDALEKLSALAADAANKEAFYSNWIVQDAVIRRLHTMAETTQRLSEQTRSRIPHVAWEDIAGLRNILVHGYLGTIDLETVWGIVTGILPEFETAVRHYYQRHYG